MRPGSLGDGGEVRENEQEIVAGDAAVAAQTMDFEAQQQQSDVQRPTWRSKSPIPNSPSPSEADIFGETVNLVQRLILKFKEAQKERDDARSERDLLEKERDTIKVTATKTQEKLDALKNKVTNTQQALETVLAQLDISVRSNQDTPNCERETPGKKAEDTQARLDKVCGHQ